MQSCNQGLQRISQALVTGGDTPVGLGLHGDRALAARGRLESVRLELGVERRVEGGSPARHENVTAQGRGIGAGESAEDRADGEHRVARVKRPGVDEQAVQRRVLLLEDLRVDPPVQAVAVGGVLGWIELDDVAVGAALDDCVDPEQGPAGTAIRERLGGGAHAGERLADAGA